MSRHIYFIALILLVSGTVGCEEEQHPIENINIDFPRGESGLVVESNGEAFLYYDALPTYQKVRSGTFDAEIRFKQLEARLQENVPRDEWSNSGSTTGMVIINYKNQSQEDYLIFDEQYAEQLFREARENIVD